MGRSTLLSTAVPAAVSALFQESALCHHTLLRSLTPLSLSRYTSLDAHCLLVFSASSFSHTSPALLGGLLFTALTLSHFHFFLSGGLDSLVSLVGHVSFPAPTHFLFSSHSPLVGGFVSLHLTLSAHCLLSSLTAALTLSFCLVHSFLCWRFLWSHCHTRSSFSLPAFSTLSLLYVFLFDFLFPHSLSLEGFCSASLLHLTSLIDFDVHCWISTAPPHLSALSLFYSAFSLLFRSLLHLEFSLHTAYCLSLLHTLLLTACLHRSLCLLLSFCLGFLLCCTFSAFYIYTCTLFFSPGVCVFLLEGEVHLCSAISFSGFLLLFLLTWVSHILLQILGISLIFFSRFSFLTGLFSPAGPATGYTGCTWRRPPLPGCCLGGTCLCLPAWAALHCLPGFCLLPPPGWEEICTLGGLFSGYHATYWEFSPLYSLFFLSLLSHSHWSSLSGRTLFYSFSLLDFFTTVFVSRCLFLYSAFCSFSFLFSCTSLLWFLWVLFSFSCLEQISGIRSL